MQPPPCLQPQEPQELSSVDMCGAYARTEHHRRKNWENSPEKGDLLLVLHGDGMGRWEGSQGEIRGGGYASALSGACKLPVMLQRHLLGGSAGVDAQNNAWERCSSACLQRSWGDASWLGTHRKPT